LTKVRRFVTLGDMALRLRRLDPERRRKRLALLAALAGAKRLASAKTARNRVAPGQVQADRVRDLIATRRRLAG
jgi:hypothetical protein